MFVFNTTFVVENSFLSEWQTWLRDAYFPIIKQLVPTASVKVFGLMSVDNSSNNSFSVQWYASMPDELSIINKQTSLAISKKANCWSEKVLTFSTILKEVNL